MRVIINRAGYLINACTFSLCGIGQGNEKLASEIARRGFRLVRDDRENRMLRSDLLARLQGGRLAEQAAMEWQLIRQAAQREVQCS